MFLVLNWFRRQIISSADTTYVDLDREAGAIPFGADGLISLTTFQGARTPVTDPLLRGALVGLSLSHTRGHIWRALMEGVCYGTRAAVDALIKQAENSVGGSNEIREIYVAGGATKSELWLQMHADITNMSVLIGKVDNSPLLGSAVLATASAMMRRRVHSSKIEDRYD